METDRAAGALPTPALAGVFNAIHGRRKAEEIWHGVPVFLAKITNHEAMIQQDKAFVVETPQHAGGAQTLGACGLHPKQT